MVSSSRTICAFAKSEWVLIVGRLGAGIGRCVIMAVGTFVWSDAVPLRRRGVWQGWGNICFGFGSGIGGFVGGWFNDTFGWRAAFFIQTPITLTAMILVFFAVNIRIVGNGMKSKFFSRSHFVVFDTGSSLAHKICAGIVRNSE